MKFKDKDSKKCEKQILFNLIHEQLNDFEMLKNYLNSSL